MSLGPDYRASSEHLSSQRIRVDLDTPLTKFFPDLPNHTSLSEKEINKVAKTTLKDCVALHIPGNGKMELAFRSADLQHRKIIDLPLTGFTFLNNVDRLSAHQILIDREKAYGKESNTLLYDRVFDNQRDFKTTDDITGYAEHLKYMLTEEGYLVIQLSDRTDDYNQKVIQTLTSLFTQPLIRPFKTENKYPMQGALYIFRKGVEMLSPFDNDTDKSEELPSGKDAVAAAESFLKDRRLVETGK